MKINPRRARRGAREGAGERSYRSIDRPTARAATRRGRAERARRHLTREATSTTTSKRAGGAVATRARARGGGGERSRSGEGLNLISRAPIDRACWNATRGTGAATRAPAPAAWRRAPAAKPIAERAAIVRDDAGSRSGARERRVDDENKHTVERARTYTCSTRTVQLAVTLYQCTHREGAAQPPGFNASKRRRGLFLQA